MKALIAAGIASLVLCSGVFAQTVEERIRILEEALKKQEQTIREQQKIIEEMKTEMTKSRTLEKQEAAGKEIPAPAVAEAPAPAPIAEAPAPAPAPEARRDILSYQAGPANLRLIDVSLDGLFAAGASTERDEPLQFLQGGGHDPRKRGFTVQNVELSLMGAVDPYFNAEAHIVYFLDPLSGESHVELEEAFFTTQRLPYNLQLKGGQFVTEFGRINAQHPHQWDWQDQPVINTRLFGPDGMRGPGFRLSWLTPLPWFSELYFGMQNANGETMVSFLSSEEAFAERPIGGRPFVSREVKSLQDLAYLGRWSNSWDLSEEVSTVLGLSGLYGPNATGPEGETWIYGADVKLKWLPANNFRGWPFLLFQSEIMRRDYRSDPIFNISRETLVDWGFYSQLLWGFKKNWVAGIRYDYATGSEENINVDFGTGDATLVSRNSDPFRGDRHRISPLLGWHATEFSRFRLQYNYDRLKGFDHREAHSIWLGAEIMLGAHAAHKY